MVLFLQECVPLSKIYNLLNIWSQSMHCHMKVFERTESKLQEYLLSLCFTYLYDKVALLILKYLFANLKYCLSSTMKMLKEVCISMRSLCIAVSIILNMWICVCLYWFICSTFMKDMKGQRGLWMLWSYSYRQFWATMWVLEMEPRSSTRREYTFNPLAIFLVLACNSYVWVND